MIAALSTLVQLAAGSLLSCEWVFVMLWTLGAWAAVLQTSKLGALEREHPELYAKMMGRRWD